jgi:hypothetical protein
MLTDAKLVTTAPSRRVCARILQAPHDHRSTAKIIALANQKLFMPEGAKMETRALRVANEVEGNDLRQFGKLRRLVSGRGAASVPACGPT